MMLEASDGGFDARLTMLSGLRVRWRGQELAVLDALHRFDLDVSSLVTGKVDIGLDQESLRTVGDIEGAVESKFPNATRVASGFVQRFGELDGAVIELFSEL